MAPPFRGLGGNQGAGGNAGMAKMLENIQKKMVEDAEKMNDRLDEARLDGSAGGGIVKAVADGHGHILSIEIKPDVVDPDDIETLQDSVLIAVREALDKAEEMRTDEQRKLMPANIPGLNLPGIL
jgi:hypothetical protein